MKRICLLVCCVILSGCMHAAPVAVKKPEVQKLPLTVSNVEREIVRDKSNRQDLIAKFGPPNSVVKHQYHVPRITDPNFKVKIPPEMMAVETWNYWTIVGMERTLLVEFYLDDTGGVLDYKITGKATTP